MSFRRRDAERLLSDTGRLCCICRKQHQVSLHHIVLPENGGTDDIGNAIPLCPNCHDEVHGSGARGRTTRGYTPDELRMHKEKTIQMMRGLTHTDHPPAPAADHDKFIFASSDRLMPESQLTSLLAGLLDDHSYLDWQFNMLVRFRLYHAQTGNQFVSKAIASRSRVLVHALAKLEDSLASHFWLYPDEQPLGDTARYCLHPDLNVDRALRVGPVERSHYREFATRLALLVERTGSAYRRYRQTVKERLLV